ncbi:MAG TPA: hypothetical protein VF531_14735 [Bacillota bacterium]
MSSSLPDWDFIQDLMANEAALGAFAVEPNPDEVQNLLDSIKQQGMIACVKDDAVFFLGQEECRQQGIPFKHQIYSNTIAQAS